MSAPSTPAPEREPIATATAQSAPTDLDRMIQEHTLHEEQISRPLLDRLQHRAPNDTTIEARAKTIAALRFAALRGTNPEDWVLFRQDTEEVGMLRGSGVPGIAQLYGISHRIWPRDERGNLAPVRAPLSDQPGGPYALSVFVLAKSEVTGIEAEFTAERRSDEQFTGRQVNEKMEIVARGGVAANPGDLVSALLSLARVKSVRVIGGFARVPRAELEAAWAGTGKSFDRTAKGHGYGTSTERQATAVAGEDVLASRAKLRDEILRCVGGDSAAAKKLCKEITANKDFGGFDTVDRLTKDWQVERAWKALQAHPIYSPAPLSDEQGGAE